MPLVVPLPMPLVRALLVGLLFAIVAVGFSVAAPSRIQGGDTIAICGDSITEQKLYSVFMEDYLLMCVAEPDVRAHQFGWSGESAPGLAKRVSYDVLPFKPTVATTLYGMNDGGYLATDPKRIASLEASTDSFVQQLHDGGVRVILVGSPGAVDTETFKTWRLAKCTPEEYNQTLANLGEAAKRVAQKHDAVWVDVHSAMLSALAKAKAKYGNAYPFGHDGVHPSFNGHLVMAYAFLKALGCEGDIGTITFDAAAGRASATAGHRVISASANSVELESSRYPFCFVDDPANPESTRAVLDCVPFNEDLNRFTLVVSHAPSPKMRVTWGKAAKVFTAEELAHGINLAAEFLDNPFSAPFSKVHEAVIAQQTYETPATKVLLTSLPAWREQFPEKSSAFDDLVKSVVSKANALEDVARKEFRPVQHSLSIAPAQ